MPKKPIGRDKRLARKRASARISTQGLTGRIGVQWQKVASCGSSAGHGRHQCMAKAARHGKRNRRERQCRVKAAAVVEMCTCMGGLPAEVLSVVKLMRWLDRWRRLGSMQSGAGCGGCYIACHQWRNLLASNGEGQIWARADMQKHKGGGRHFGGSIKSPWSWSWSWSWSRSRSWLWWWWWKKDA